MLYYVVFLAEAIFSSWYLGFDVFDFGMTLLILSTLGSDEGAAFAEASISSILSLYLEMLSDETEMVFLGSCF